MSMSYNIIGDGAIGTMIAETLESAGQQYALFGRQGAVTAPAPEFSERVLLVAVKCNQIQQAIADSGDQWGLAAARIGAVNGILDEQFQELGFDGFFSLSVGVTRNRAGKLKIVVAAPSWIVPVGRAFSPDLESRLKKLASDLTAQGVPTEVLNEVELGREFRWGKLFYNCVANPLSAITGLPMANLASTPVLGPVIAHLVAEFNEVAEAAGVLFRGNVEKALTFLEQGRGHVPSTALDMARGRPTEIAFLNGAIVDLGIRHGVEAPLNGLLVRLVTDGLKLSPKTLRELTDFTLSNPYRIAA